MGLLRSPVRLDRPEAAATILPETLGSDGGRLAAARDDVDRVTLVATLCVLVRQVGCWVLLDVLMRSHVAYLVGGYFDTHRLGVCCGVYRSQRLLAPDLYKVPFILFVPATVLSCMTSLSSRWCTAVLLLLSCAAAVARSTLRPRCVRVCST